MYLGGGGSWLIERATVAAPVMFPGNRVLFIELLTNPRWEDWDYEYGYAGNRCVSLFTLSSSLPPALLSLTPLCQFSSVQRDGGDSFGYWGNGFTMRELDGRDTTFYYGLLEEGKDVQPDYEDIRPLYMHGG